MHDPEVLDGEALSLREVVREALRDRDVDVRERSDRAIRDPEPPALPKLVETVLRREPERNARRRSRELPVDVGVNEVRVQDPRASPCEIRSDLAEGDRVDVGPQSHIVDRYALRAQCLGEVPRSRLVLVEHEEPDVPAPLSQVGQQLEQMGLGAGDPGDLLRVQDDAVDHEIPAASRTPRAHDRTE